MLALGLIISYVPFEQIIMLMADIRRNQMIFWMSFAGLEAFIISKMIYILLGFVCFRRKYERTDITFESIADLRKELPSQDTLSILQRIKSYVLHRKLPSQDTVSTLQLLKCFVKKMKNKKEKANLVRYSFA